MTTLGFWLPWPPSLNRAWRTVNGRVLLSEVGRDYARQIVNALPKGRVERLAGRLTVGYDLYPPVKLRAKWDIANREKVLSDALTKAGVWLDDSQIDHMTIRRRSPQEEGGVLVTIEERI